LLELQGRTPAEMSLKRRLQELLERKLAECAGDSPCETEWVSFGDMQVCSERWENALHLPRALI
jgi:hypothetical protein